jgi:hypothetical protein
MDIRFNDSNLIIDRISIKCIDIRYANNTQLVEFIEQYI